MGAAYRQVWQDIEDLPHRLFPMWKMPLLVSFLLYLAAYFLTLFRSTSCTTDDDGNTDWGVDWEKVGDNWYKYSHKAANCHAVWLLSLCYIPGCIAAYFQLCRCVRGKKVRKRQTFHWFIRLSACRGTKYSKFPRWLAGWLNMRKQLGLLMMGSATYHAYAYFLSYSEGAQMSFKEQTYLVSAY